jgi:hypothetical protein
MRRWPAILLLLAPAACVAVPAAAPPPPPDRASIVAMAATRMSQGDLALGEEILGGGGEEAVPWLTELAASPDREVRERAQALLMAVGEAVPLTMEERVAAILRELCRDTSCETGSLLALARLREAGAAALPHLRAAASGTGPEAEVARRLLGLPGEDR